jgi:hypothetical protein
MDQRDFISSNHREKFLSIFEAWVEGVAPKLIKRMEIRDSWDSQVFNNH